jgi:hypothetical protein
MDAVTRYVARTRIQIEYIEMPDLKLTRAQIGRLCNVSTEACSEALATLVRNGFLSERADGSFVRRGVGRVADAVAGPTRLHHGRRA